MWTLIVLPFFLQTIVITLDEVCFHIKRGLPRWERIGHPLDTFSVLLCFLFVLQVPYSSQALKGYIALSIVSCLLVTKDESVHKHCCPAAEHWLHALLFLNHPILLTVLGLVWPLLHGSKSLSFLSPWQEALPLLQGFLYFQGITVFFFMCYQIIYWNFIYAKKQQDQ